MTNLCIDRYRADQRRPRLVDLESLQDDNLADDDAELTDPVIRAEDAAIVREALSLLSPLHRAALVKREIEEKSLPQIAAELGVPEHNVKHLLYRARRALRRLLLGTSVQPGTDAETECAPLAHRLARSAHRIGALVLVLICLPVAASTLRAINPDPASRSSRAAATHAAGSNVPAIVALDAPVARDGMRRAPHAAPANAIAVPAPFVGPK
ncbi:MAG: RNA polymerase sigma factor, partial [Frankia sp.]|nr:RNA polymerase sigma factor [Frankia sp.]